MNQKELKNLKRGDTVKTSFGSMIVRNIGEKNIVLWFNGINATFRIGDFLTLIIG